MNVKPNPPSPTTSTLDTDDRRERIPSQLRQIFESLMKEPFGEFIRMDRTGLRHSLEVESKAPSLSSMASFIGARSVYPQIGPDVSPSEFESWAAYVQKFGIDAPTSYLNENISIIETDPSNAVLIKNVYRLAHTCSALKKPAPEILSIWLENYCKSWLLRTHVRFSFMYLLHLVDSCVKDKNSNVERLLSAVAEEVFWRQLALVNTNSINNFYPIDLALSIIYCRRQLPLNAYSQACELLNMSARKNGTWLVHPPIQDTGVPTCSSFYALNALLEFSEYSSSHGSEFNESALCHMIWLIDSEPKGITKWFSTDLQFRLPGPELWFNFIIIGAISRILSWLTYQKQQIILDRYQTQYSIKTDLTWENILIDKSAHQALTDTFINKATMLTSDSRLESCTALLFGPPGTAKTTIAEVIAATIRWPLVEIGIAEFLSKGVDGVFEQSQSVFKDLIDLERVVVLLDEVEGVFLDRSGNAEAFQKMLTSSLLPPLKRLHDKGKIILIIATNHIDGFDDAVQRPGRIDLVIPVGPPDRISRIDMLKRFGINDSIVEMAADLIGDRGTIGELKSIKSYTTECKNDITKFKNQWNLDHGDRYLISNEVMEKFQKDAINRMRLR